MNTKIILDLMMRIGIVTVISRNVVMIIDDIIMIDIMTGEMNVMIKDKTMIFVLKIGITLR